MVQHQTLKMLMGMESTASREFGGLLSDLLGGAASDTEDVDEHGIYFVGVENDGKNLSLFNPENDVVVEMQLFIDQTPTALPGPDLSNPRVSSQYASTGTEHSVPLRGKPSTVIMAISLKAMTRYVISDLSRSWGEVAEYLGINATSENSTARMWRDSHEDCRSNEDRIVDEARVGAEDCSVDGDRSVDDNRLDDEDRDETRIGASCVERILTVSSVLRMRWGLAALSSRPDGIPNIDSGKNDSVKSDSVKSADQISAAESLRSNATPLVEGPEGTEGTGPTYIKLLHQLANMDALEESSITWKWDEVREHLCR